MDPEQETKYIDQLLDLNKKLHDISGNYIQYLRHATLELIVDVFFFLLFFNDKSETFFLLTVKIENTCDCKKRKGRKQFFSISKIVF